ncbi:MASE3 domain-containing protein [Leptospira stimsonii]|uniref:Membrane-associated sensor domain-containing protein n=1 Tax=Leptospira stimsonii TaxID=2202203 RepID=A0A396Z1K3_9LEPT|nr:hypothetical protein DLM75_16255 [Leptospira stimsonii]
MPAPDYLVFHNVAEVFSITVSISIFGLGWFTYKRTRNYHSLFIFEIRMFQRKYRFKARSKISTSSWISPSNRFVPFGIGFRFFKTCVSGSV